MEPRSGRYAMSGYSLHSFVYQFSTGSGLSIEQLRAAAKALDVTPGTILEMVDTAEKEVKERGVRIDSSWTSLPLNSLASAAVDAVSRGNSKAASGAAAGIAVGAVIPIVGSALGALIGGVIGNYLDKKKN